MPLHFLRKVELIKIFLCLGGFILEGEGYHRSWRKYEADKVRPTSPSIKGHKGLALHGYIASLIDFSFVVSYHYKESGRLFCSGSIISPYWTISVPNCFRIPTYYYRNKLKKILRRKRESNEYPYGNLSLAQSLTVKPRNYSSNELRVLRDVLSLKPETVVVMTVFDKVYIPCKEQYVRIGKQIVIHPDYNIPSHDAEIALLKVSDSLIDDYDIKIPNIAPISIEGEKQLSCEVVGYGSLKLNRTIYSQPVLSQINVDVYAPETCQTISRTYNVVIDAPNSSYVCSYNKKYRYGSPLSQGDSGAPLLCDEQVVGVAQWVFSPIPAYLTYGPSQPTPHLYTRLDSYQSWIYKYINDTEEIKLSIYRERLKTFNSGSDGHAEFIKKTLIIIFFTQSFVYCYYLTGMK